VALTEKNVRDIAHLARLGLADEAVTRVQSELDQVLELVTALQAIDTSGIEPMAHPGDATLRLRADSVTESNRREQLQEVAPQTEDGFYLVPRVVE